MEGWWDVSGGLEQIPVRCSLPRARLGTFTYITTLYSAVELPNLVEGCGCEEAEECEFDACPCPQSYNAGGKLENFDGPVYECGDNCSCPSSCTSRIVQRGLRHQLEVFDTGKRGLGLRTIAPIERHSFVVQYAGALLTLTEATAAAKHYDASGCNYLLILKENYGVKQPPHLTCIDAGAMGNAARFMNHSCDPNLASVAVRVGSPVPHVAFFACSDIAAGAELTISYGSSGGGHQSCLCDSAACRGKLPFDAEM